MAISAQKDASIISFKNRKAERINVISQESGSDLVYLAQEGARLMQWFPSLIGGAPVKLPPFEKVHLHIEHRMVNLFAKKHIAAKFSATNCSEYVTSALLRLAFHNQYYNKPFDLLLDSVIKTESVRIAAEACFLLHVMFKDRLDWSGFKCGYYAQTGSLLFADLYGRSFKGHIIDEHIRDLGNFLLFSEITREALKSLGYHFDRRRNG